MASRYTCYFPARVFLRHKSKVARNCCTFKFLRRSVDGKHLMRFQRENVSVSNVSSDVWTLYIKLDLVKSCFSVNSI